MLNPNKTSILKTFFLLTVLSVPFALGQGNRSTISGFIFDVERRPVAQVWVELYSDFSTVGRVRTDGSGRYYFGGLGNGRYTVKVLPLGTPFAEQSSEVEISGIGVRGQPLADNVQRDIYLKLRRTANTEPFQNTVVYAQDVPKEAEALYTNAIADLDSQRIQTGIESLEKALVIFPRYFMALQRLGAVRITQDQFPEAADLFARAVEINDRSFDSWYGLAYANYSQRKFAEAASGATKAVFNRPESPEAHLLLGMSLRLTGDLPGAEKSMKKADKLFDGKSADVHWQLALLYGKEMNKFAEAAKELETYLKVVPDAPNKEEIKKLIQHFKEKIRPT